MFNFYGLAIKFSGNPHHRSLKNVIDYGKQKRFMPILS